MEQSMAIERDSLGEKYGDLSPQTAAKAFRELLFASGLVGEYWEPTASQEQIKNFVNKVAEQEHVWFGSCPKRDGSVTLYFGPGKSGFEIHGPEDEKPTADASDYDTVVNLLIEQGVTVCRAEKIAGQIREIRGEE